MHPVVVVVVVGGSHTLTQHRLKIVYFKYRKREEKTKSRETFIGSTSQPRITDSRFGCWILKKERSKKKTHIKLLLEMNAMWTE